MEQRVLDEEEEELYGIARKRPLDGEELTAELDDEYVYEGYPDVDDGEIFPEAEGQDDESLVMLSPEEAEKLIREREEKAKADAEKVKRCVAEGNEALTARNYVEARKLFGQANALAPDDLEVNVGYMRAYAEDFASLENFSQIDEAYGMCYESAGEAFALRIQELFGARLSQLQREISAEKAEKEKAFTAEQAERRRALKVRADKESGRLVGCGLPLFAFVLATVVCGVFITAVEGNIFLILTVVFGGLAAALLLPTLLFLRRTVNARRLQRENEQLSSTELGRELMAMEGKLEFLSDCLE